MTNQGNHSSQSASPLSFWRLFRSAVDAARAQGLSVGHIHLRWLNPFPANLESLLRSYEQVLVTELNLGQLAHVLRAEFLLDVHSYTKIQGQPFKVSEILARIQILSH